MAPQTLRLYSDLATWWPLMSPPSDYVEEAADLLPLLRDGAVPGGKPTLLELGSGGGSLAWHLAPYFELTLTDRAPGMLAVSRTVNPTVEHLVGDMTTMDLGRTFDRVLVHDAIMYATTPAEARATIATAERHCRDGGRVVILPDCVLETFEPSTEHGGEDGRDGRGLRYLMWTHNLQPGRQVFQVDYAFMLRHPDGHVDVEHDRHHEGCFALADWLAWLAAAGLETRVHHDPWNRDVLIGEKRRAG